MTFVHLLFNTIMLTLNIITCVAVVESVFYVFLTFYYHSMTNQSIMDWTWCLRISYFHVPKPNTQPNLIGIIYLLIFLRTEMSCLTALLCDWQNKPAGDEWWVERNKESLSWCLSSFLRQTRHLQPPGSVLQTHRESRRGCGLAGVRRCLCMHAAMYDSKYSIISKIALSSKILNHYSMFTYKFLFISSNNISLNN